MDIRRLGWAGFELTSADTTLVIDAVASFGTVERFMSGPPLVLPPPTRPVAAALVTHLHGDHTDTALLADVLVPGAPVLRPPSAPRGAEGVATAEAEAGLAERGLAADVLAPWEQRTVGPFTITALPAVDGFGDPQLSWLVEADGTRIVHLGDTLFHGHWWSIALRGGPIDVALLPINGAVCDFPNCQPPSPFGADMDPRQAATAAHILGAARAVPMHYDALHVPGVYEQVDDPLGSFRAAAERLGVPVSVVAEGARLPAA